MKKTFIAYAIAAAFSAPSFASNVQVDRQLADHFTQQLIQGQMDSIDAQVLAQLNAQPNLIAEVDGVVYEKQSNGTWAAIGAASVTLVAGLLSGSTSGSQSDGLVALLPELDNGDKPVQGPDFEGEQDWGILPGDGDRNRPTLPGSDLDSGWGVDYKPVDNGWGVESDSDAGYDRVPGKPNTDGGSWQEVLPGDGDRNRPTLPGSDLDSGWGVDYKPVDNGWGVESDSDAGYDRVPGKPNTDGGSWQEVLPGDGDRNRPTLPGSDLDSGWGVDYKPVDNGWGVESDSDAGYDRVPGKPNTDGGSWQEVLPGDGDRNRPTLPGSDLDSGWGVDYKPVDNGWGVESDSDAGYDRVPGKPNTDGGSWQEVLPGDGDRNRPTLPGSDLDSGWGVDYKPVDNGWGVESDSDAGYDRVPGKPNTDGGSWQEVLPGDGDRNRPTLPGSDLDSGWGVDYKPVDNGWGVESDSDAGYDRVPGKPNTDGGSWQEVLPGDGDRNRPTLPGSTPDIDDNASLLNIERVDNETIKVSGIYGGEVVITDGEGRVYFDPNDQLKENIERYRDLDENKKQAVKSRVANKLKALKQERVK